MKMELITALLHNPILLFLDEPTIGLDAVAQKQVRVFLQEINRTRKTTIILTSHYIEDVRSLCERSVVINNGKKIYDGSTEKLFSGNIDRVLDSIYTRGSETVEGME
jgi:ABC-2 type transport system ATP-binding protein